MKIAAVLSADGKLVTDQGLLKRFDLPPYKPAFLSFQDAEEFEVTILPIILNGQERPTLTGVPGEFLEIPVEFSLVSKQVKKGVCSLRYRRKSGGRGGI
ncbi:MAG: hypothetical protein K2W99_01955 [Chthoniobacterales bacterium]|nr:hypothetical protein [Chthoniobacterales bacterium]